MSGEHQRETNSWGSEKRASDFLTQISKFFFQEQQILLGPEHFALEIT
jgi:hypothetical protein